MTFKDDCSVTVIGAGIVCICSALSLLEKGTEVRLTDRDAAVRDDDGVAA